MGKRREDFNHEVRHGLTTIYYERKRLLNEMLNVAQWMESRRLPNVVKLLRITWSMRKQLNSIRQIDSALLRITAALTKYKEEKHEET